MATSSSMTGANGVGRLRPTHPAGGPARSPHAQPHLRRFIVRAAVAALVVPLWFAFLAPQPFGGPLSLIWVSGTSMEPTLSTGDLAVLYRAEEYQVGDIVAFEIPEGGTVIHRVIEVGPDGHRFQGDNRDFHDPWVLDGSEILGREIFSVPHAARAMTTVGRPEVMASLAAGLVVFWRLRRNDTKARASVGQADSVESEKRVEPAPSDSGDSSPTESGPSAATSASSA
ncbi:MAG: signal peptidase I [Ornithinimicrobium sp.]